MDLEFTLYLSNTDGEYGDSLSMTFPVGITPVSSPNNPLYTSIDAQAKPEALRGISGQTIRWGDNDNVYGGIPVLREIDFTVKVTIGSTVKNNQIGTFFVSGERSGSNPKDYSGTFIMKGPATAPDVAIQGIPPYFSYATPLDQTYPTPMGILVVNGGATLSTQQKVQINMAPGGFNDSKNLPNPFIANSFDVLESKEMTFTSAGIYDTYLDATFASDEDNLNNKDTVTFEVTKNYYAANKGDITRATSLGFSTKGIIGTVVEVVTQDTIDIVNAYFANPTAGAIAQGVIYDFDPVTNKVGSLRRITPMVTLTNKPQYKDFDTHFIAKPGFYLVAVAQENEINYGLGVTLDNYEADHNFLAFNYVFYSFEIYEPIIHYTPYIRAFTSARGSVGVTENTSKELAVYPNPTSGLIKVTGLVSADFSIMNSLGQVVKSGIVNQENQLINLSDHAAGNYTLRLESADGVSYKQISLVK